MNSFSLIEESYTSNYNKQQVNRQHPLVNKQMNFTFTILMITVTIDNGCDSLRGEHNTVYNNYVVHIQSSSNQKHNIFTICMQWFIGLLNFRVGLFNFFRRKCFQLNIIKHIWFIINPFYINKINC